jgi:hypothetical protein
MEERRCGNCGAVLGGGTYRCDYCGTDWTPPAKEATRAGRIAQPPVASPAPVRSDAARIVIFFVLLLFCGPISLIYLWAAVPWTKKAKALITLFLFILPAIAGGIFGLFYETVYAVKSQASKFSASAPALEQRRAEPIDSKQVYVDLRDAEKRSLGLRKNTFKQKYEGHWVTWEGTVEKVSTYTSLSGELHLKPAEGNFIMEFFFDPLSNARFSALAAGDHARVSAKLWGYYFIGDRILLSDAALVSSSKKSGP